jgi:alpha-glucosidase
MAWWKSAVIYQVYPRSFQDSNGDGVGDLAGVKQRLDYLAWLGADALWLSPFYRSPMADFGYDVSDYCDVDPLFGTLADFDDLVREARARNLKIIVDFVPNHSSIEHPWFVESRSSRHSPKRDWYVWRDPAPGGGPPNNWISHFGGSAWQYDARTGQYYHHAYLAEQPDLNWQNPEVRAAMADAMRFWLKRGADGVRVDVMWHLAKDAQFRDNPPNLHWRPGQPEVERLLPLYSADQPEVHEIVRELRGVVDEFGERVLIGEIYLPLDRLVRYYGEGGGGAHLPFNFQLIETPWRAEDIAHLIRRYEGCLPENAWPNWVIGNHDRPRIAARVGDDQARLAMMLLLTLRGTPTIYYGDEIGIGYVPIPAGKVQDPWERNEPGKGLGRDPVRTPMPWDGSEKGGFTTGEPWLPLPPDHARLSVEAQSADPRSMLALTRDLLRLRKSSAALRLGDVEVLPALEGVLAYARRAPGSRAVVALNMTGEAKRLTDLPFSKARMTLSTLGGIVGEAETIHLRPHEGVVLAADDAAARSC